MYAIRLNRGVKNEEFFVVAGGEFFSSDPIVYYNVFSKQSDLFAFTIQYWYIFRRLGNEVTPLDTTETSNTVNLGTLYSEEDVPYPDLTFEKLIYKDFRENFKF